MNVDKFGRHSYTGMTIDKFGRHSSRERLRGPKGEGFKLTSGGNYDMENKTLCNVANPLNLKDAVNLKTLQALPCLKLTSSLDKYDAKNKVISNVGVPVQKSDVVTKQFLEGLIPNKLLFTNIVFRTWRLPQTATVTQ